MTDGVTFARWRNRIVGYVEDFPVSELLANPQNWRIHPAYQQQALEDVLDEVGWVDTVLINRTTSFVVDGHLRAALAISHDEPTVPALIVELTEAEEALILASFDPISALAAADREKLRELTEQINTSNVALRAMFDSLLAQDRAAFGEDDLSGDGSHPAPSEDRAADLNDIWGVEPGQVWSIQSRNSDLQAHRLMCGDSREPATRAVLFDGSHPNGVITDPPYSVDIVGRNNTAGNFPGVHASRTTVTPIVGDDAPIDLTHLLSLAPVLIIWGGNYFADQLPRGGKWLVWDKKDGGFQDFDLGDCELAWTNLEGTSRLLHHTHMGMVRAGAGERSARLHPTQKPVALLAWCIEQARLSPGQIVFDPYSGSGSTIVAAEQMSIAGYGCDIEPKYIAATLQRLSDMGLNPERIV